MKVKCINNDLAQKFLTVGKEYDVILVTRENYVVTNNNGTEGGWDISRFIEVPEPQSHHNTTNLKGDDFFNTNNTRPKDIAKETAKNITQNNMVLIVFLKLNKPLTATDCEEIMKDMPILQKSIRRSLSVLCTKGVIEKTPDTKLSPYKKPEHYYKLK